MEYHALQDLLNHACLVELIEEQQCCCIIEGCEENQSDLNSLARHLILQHYDKLEEYTFNMKNILNLKDILIIIFLVLLYTVNAPIARKHFLTS